LYLLTPTEIVDAHDMGANFVKLFPAGEFGIKYIKALMAPITHISMMGVGRVNLDNIGIYSIWELKG
jgi:2-dehydro-3-deoxyphosphogluconate aldolase/(4S)-4-hydroxy-2-oxoglutarate aldolase